MGVGFGTGPALTGPVFYTQLSLPAPRGKTRGNYNHLTSAFKSTNCCYCCQLALNNGTDGLELGAALISLNLWMIPHIGQSNFSSCSPNYSSVRLKSYHNKRPEEKVQLRRTWREKVTVRTGNSHTSLALPSTILKYFVTIIPLNKRFHYVSIFTKKKFHCPQWWSGKWIVMLHGGKGGNRTWDKMGQTPGISVLPQEEKQIN